MRLRSCRLWMRLRSSRLWMRFSRPWTRSSRLWMRSSRMWTRSSRVVRRLTANAEVATVLGSISASSDAVPSEERQMKQCWRTYVKTQKSPLKNTDIWKFCCLDQASIGPRTSKKLSTKYYLSTDFAQKFEYSPSLSWLCFRGIVFWWDLGNYF